VSGDEQAVSARHRMLIRSWEILLMLRDKPSTLAELADALRVHERTVRRDLDALCQVGFPITTSRDDIETQHLQAVWSLAPMPEWPRQSHTPTGRRSGRMSMLVNRGGLVNVRQ
jgi:biotin operon repressor